MSGVDINSDVEANTGKAIEVGNNFTVDGRMYGMHDGTLYPVSGEGIVILYRGGV